VKDGDGDIPAIMSYNAVSVAYRCDAKALIVLTETGHAARLLSRLRPRMPIYAFLTNEKLYHQIALNWGVEPFIHSGKGTRLDAVVNEVLSITKHKRTFKKRRSRGGLWPACHWRTREPRI